eukprot:2971040-Lingulodinium_polyedra.AAC.1
MARARCLTKRRSAERGPAQPCGIRSSGPRRSAGGCARGRGSERRRTQNGGRSAFACGGQRTQTGGERTQTNAERGAFCVR